MASTRVILYWMCLPLGVIVSSQAWAGATFTGLGHLAPAPGFSRANAISPDGTIIVGQASITPGPAAFMWTEADGMQPLPELAGGTYEASASAVTDSGIMVGQSAGFQGSEAVRWVGGSLQQLGELSGGVYFSVATGISSDASRVVGSSAAGPGVLACDWNPSIASLSLPAGVTLGSANAITPDGQFAVGEGLDSIGTVALVWLLSTPASLPRLIPTGDMRALAISTDASTIVGAATTSNGSEAFRRVGVTITPLGDLAGGPVDSVARAVSGDGTVVVGRATTDAGSEAFLWTPTDGMRRLIDVASAGGAIVAGWTFIEATGISSDGRSIVGYGVDPNGRTQAWLLRLDETSPTCVADVDDGSGTGTPDGGVTIDDLLYYLSIFNQGLVDADVDDGSGTGTLDGGVTIDDLLYYLLRFNQGC